MLAKKGESEAQIVKARLLRAYEAFGLTTTGLVIDKNKTDEIRVKYLAVATPLLLAVKGIYKEGGIEYTSVLALANAFIDEIVRETEKATKGKSILIT